MKAHPGHGVNFYKWPQLSMVTNWLHDFPLIPGDTAPNTQ